MQLLIILVTLVSISMAQEAQPSPLLPDTSLTVAPVVDGPVYADPVPVFERNQAVSTAHDILGWSTVGMALLTGFTAPMLAEHESHEIMGNITGVLAGATLATGYWAHYEEVWPNEGSSSNNIHTALGIVGGLLMVATPFIAPAEAHAATGMAGALMMTTAVSWKIFF